MDVWYSSGGDENVLYASRFDVDIDILSQATMQVFPKLCMQILNYFKILFNAMCVCV